MKFQKESEYDQEKLQSQTNQWHHEEEALNSKSIVNGWQKFDYIN